MLPQVLVLARANGNPVETAFRRSPLGPTDPFGDHRLIAWAGQRGAAAGIVTWRGTFETPRFPHVEMIVVHAGRLELKSQAATLSLGRGDSAVIACGAALQISATQEASFAFCATSSVGAGHGAMTRLVAQAALSPSNPPPTDVLIGPAPVCRSFNAFLDETASLRAGIWDSTPYRRQVRPHKVNELMHLIEGSVTFTDGAELNVTAEAGDTVFVPNGAACSWDSTVHVRKFYAIQDAASVPAN